MDMLYKLLLSVLLVGIVGCASSVKRLDDSSSYKYDGEKYKTVKLTVSETATEDPNDRVRFDEAKLRDIIERKLDVTGLLAKSSANSIEVEITDIRVRSAFNAFMWGFMAGNDHIRGNVSLIGENGAPSHTFHVSASYALGGFAGTNETRMSWLYEEFSKLVLQEISGDESIVAAKN